MRCLRALLRAKLVHHDASGVEGYRLTPLGYDFLALRALLARGAISAVGRQIGVGKESDVYEASTPRPPLGAAGCRVLASWLPLLVVPALFRGMAGATPWAAGLGGVCA